MCLINCKYLINEEIILWGLMSLIKQKLFPEMPIFWGIYNSHSISGGFSLNFIE